MSRVGDHGVILDGSNEERAIVRIMKMAIFRYSEIDEDFANEEGDGSLSNWRAIHEEYYQRHLHKIGKELTASTELVCMWFEAVYS